MTAPHPSHTVPCSILIVGSGAFGLSILHALLLRPAFSSTKLTLLEAHPTYPPPHAASIDNTRIIRADYADADYAALARQAQHLWRGSDWGAEGRYTENGLLLTADAGERNKAYVDAALANVRDPSHGAPVVETPSSAAIADAMRGNPPDAAAGSGVCGYLNQASGWADAEACMRSLHTRVEALSKEQGNRVTFLAGHAARVTADPATGRATGVELADGRAITAGLTILATGAWTPSLVDMRGVAAARGQCIAYVPVSPAEQAALRTIPVHLNLSNGMFFFPPTDGQIKVARHAFGYTNPVAVEAPYGAAEAKTTATAGGAAIIKPNGADPANPLKPATSTITVTVPTFPNDLPLQDSHDLKSFLQTALPSLFSVATRPHKGRICWYLDTASANFLVCHYPGDAHDMNNAHNTKGIHHSTDNHDSNPPQPTQTNGIVPAHDTPAQTNTSGIFLATAGSGHAFKFLPVLGERCLDVLDGTDARDNGGAWTRKWAWPGRTARAGGGDDDDGVWCEDGSRAGVRGLKLGEAYG